MRMTLAGRRRIVGRAASIALLALVYVAPVSAQLRLDITEGVKDAVPVAIVPFAGQPEGGPNDVADVVAGDLRLSGRFAPLDRADIVERPSRASDVRLQDWRLLKADYLVIGEVGPDAGTVRFELVNVRTGQ